MFVNLSKKNTNILIGIWLFAVMLFEMYFLSTTHILFTVNISIGFLIGFYICCGKKALPGIFISVVVARFIGGILFYNFPLHEAIPHTLIYTLYMTLLMFGIGFFTKRFKCEFPNTFKRGLRFALVVSLVTLFASAVPTTFHVLMKGCSFLTEIQLFIKPTSIGIFIFTTLVIFSSKYDGLLSKYTSKIGPYFLFFISFTAITYFTFHISVRNGNLTYIAPIMLILFMVHAFIYNFRLLIINSISYILFYSISLQDFPQLNPEGLISSFNVLLLSIVGVTIFSKILIQETRKRWIDLEQSNHKLESMMESTFDLFKAQDFIDTAEEAYVDTYLTNVFNIACQLFTKMDSGICVRTVKNKVNIIASKNYDLKVLRSWDLKKNNILWNYDKPIHSKDTKLFYNRILESSYEEYKDILHSIKESVRFVIPLGNNEFGGITMEVHASNKESFSETDIENITHLQKMLLSFYDKNQLSLKNTNLKDDIVLSLIRTLELFDQYTGGHSEDVADLGKLVAQKLKLPSEDVYNIYWAGIVHDIGKIGVDPAIINKDSKLTLEEYEAVKVHPINGYSILNRSEDLKDIAVLVRHHHEWWNGQGYPDKLQGNEIPFGSQILQVADSVSSMATKRPYSSIKTMNEIKEELILYSGTQFSPKVVKAMIQLIEEGHVLAYYNSRRK